MKKLKTIFIFWYYIYREMIRRVDRIFVLIWQNENISNPVFPPAHFFVCLYAFHKERCHEHLAGIMAWISGPVGSGVTRAGWNGLSRATEPFPVCLWTSEEENAFFCKWPDLFFPHHVEWTRQSLKYCWQEWEPVARPGVVAESQHREVNSNCPHKAQSTESWVPLSEALRQTQTG